MVFSAPEKEKRESCKMFIFFNFLKHEIKKKKKKKVACFVPKEPRAFRKIQ